MCVWRVLGSIFVVLYVLYIVPSVVYMILRLHIFIVCVISVCLGSILFIYVCTWPPSTSRSMCREQARFLLC